MRQKEDCETVIGVQAAAAGASRPKKGPVSLNLSRIAESQPQISGTTPHLTPQLCQTYEVPDAK